MDYVFSGMYGWASIHFHEYNISARPSGDFLKIGTNVYLDSMINWLDDGGQRSL